MLHSENINELMGALAKAQSEMSYAVKDNNNPYFKSTYADLGGVWDACRKPLSAHGLAVSQVLTTDGEHTSLVTILGHSSGQWVKSFMMLPIQKPGPQEIGSCITYCRRYALAAMVGVYQDDDDAEAAQMPYREAKEAPKLDPINKKELDTMRKLLTDLGSPKGEKFMCEQAKVESLEQFPKYKYEDAINYIKRQIEAKNHGSTKVA